MESISLLLEEALSPYQVTLTTAGVQGECLVTVKNPAGAIVVEREVDRAQLTDKRVLVDVVDCLLRDLKIAENRRRAPGALGHRCLAQCGPDPQQRPRMKNCLSAETSYGVAGQI